MDILLLAVVGSLGGRLMKARPKNAPADDCYQKYHISTQTHGAARHHHTHISRRTVKTSYGTTKTYYKYF